MSTARTEGARPGPRAACAPRLTGTMCDTDRAINLRLWRGESTAVLNTETDPAKVLASFLRLASAVESGSEDVCVADATKCPHARALTAPPALRAHRTQQHDAFCLSADLLHFQAAQVEQVETLCKREEEYFRTLHSDIGARELG